jgi:hypothetical protein
MSISEPDAPTALAAVVLLLLKSRSLRWPFDGLVEKPNPDGGPDSLRLGLIQEAEKKGKRLCCNELLP